MSNKKFTSEPLPEKVVLVHVTLPSNANTTEDELHEFEQLTLATGAIIVAKVIAKRQTPDAKYFVGSGKAEEIRQQVIAFEANLVIFNHTLSPAQERNLEQIIQCRVLDRTGLILDIFAQRARTFEGKLQVELAQLDHLSARLKRGWTHLERQRGGIGLRGGPGETQLEIDKRLIKQRIITIKKSLTKVVEQRKQSQRSRKKASIPVVSLVGYTNAGKSTLFNRLTQSDVYVANKLFATLDPTLRRLYIPEFGNIVVADTVGFIRYLPHELVEAFRATLEETKDADILLHVVDASDDEHLAKIQAVQEVLTQIGATNVPQLLVYNKIDLLNNQQNLDITTHIDYNQNNLPQRVWFSAYDKNCNKNLLLQAIREILIIKKS